MNFITKKLNIKLFLLLLVYVNCSLTLFSQVTIGVTEEANKGSLLQLKNEQGVTDDAANASKGLLLPRVNLSEKYELFPMFLKDPTDITSGRTTEYNTNKKDYDLQHTGLMVYNMNEYYEKDLCLGINTWDGEKWNCAHYATYDYEMDCSTVKVSGIYYKNVDLDSSHKITLRIRADEKMEGKTYYIKTDEIDGISFFAQGKITSAAATPEGQEVVMKGKGKSTNREIKRFTLTANNTSGQTCSATVIVVIPRKKVLALANGENYGYNISLTNTGSYKVFTESSNFGVTEESTMKYEGTEFANHKTPYLTAYTANEAYAQINVIRKGLLEETEGNKIDIVVVAQDLYIHPDLAQVLAEFVNQKGVLIVFNEGNGYFDITGTERARGSITNLMKAIWSEKSSTISDFGYSRRVNYDGDGDSYPGAVYKLENVDDMILNGPFGDARGKQWGEDASWARAVKNIPMEDIIVYSYAANMMLTDSEQNTATKDMITGFRHKTKNFIYFGEGGFSSSTNLSGKHYHYPPTGAPLLEQRTCLPFYWKNEGGKNFIPIPKPGYGERKDINQSRTRFDVYNSIVFANIMAWAVYQAEVNGINPPKGN